MRNKIILFNAKPYDREFFESANRSHGFEIQYTESHLTLETAALARGFQVVCVFANDTLTAPLIEALYHNGTQLIALRCAGYNNVDLKAAKDKIAVVRVPFYSQTAVAEHAVALMLALNRKLHHAHMRVRENNFSIVGLMGFDMRGKTAGVIGCGLIGKATINILKGFGMRVLGYDIAPEEVKKAGVEFADLPTLYRESDIITLHCPLTAENTHMIDRRAIAQMKDGVMIINTGRGALIHTADLIAAVKSHKIGSAGLDVYEGETPYFYDDLSLSIMSDDALARLETFPNVLITSHQAFFTKEALENIANTTLQNIADFEKGKPLINAVS
ncbi:MAG: 2-hydroxyacid dehydrogenase [Chlamydiota bacterium]